MHRERNGDTNVLVAAVACINTKGIGIRAKPHPPRIGIRRGIGGQILHADIGQLVVVDIQVARQRRDERQRIVEDVIYLSIQI